MDEKGCFVAFVLIAQMNAELNARQKQKDFLRFINEKNDIFDALDININVPPGTTTRQSYDLAQ